MAQIHEITIWTRGVTMDKEGRDIASAIGNAAKMGAERNRRGLNALLAPARGAAHA